MNASQVTMTISGTSDPHKLVVTMDVSLPAGERINISRQMPTANYTLSELQQALARHAEDKLRMLFPDLPS